MNRFSPLVAIVLSFSVLLPGALSACGCGCGLFDAQTSAPASAEGAYPLSGAAPAAGQGGFGYLEYGNINQNQNWRGGKSGDNDANADKLLRTELFTAAVQYPLAERWGLMAEVPLWSRYFKSADDDGNPVSSNDNSVGDVRVRGVYGLADGMATGLTFGLKLPTGDITAPGFDRDSQIGTGSTDLLLGAYHLGRIFESARWSWFGNAVLDQPALTAGGYRPGAELDAALGGAFGGLSFSGLRLSPGARAVFSARGRDSGALAHSQDTGYTRLLVGPALQAGFGRLLVDGSVGLPVAQNVYGNQLMASQYWRASVGVRF